MNILGLFKTIGKGLVRLEGTTIGQTLTTAAVTAVAPEALPWLGAGLKLMGSTQKAVAATEIVYQDKATGTASPEKKQHALEMINADLEVYRDVADATGHEFSYDGAEMDKLVEQTLAYLDQVNKVRSSMKLTPKPSA